MKFLNFKKPTTKWLLLFSAAVLIIVGAIIGVSSCNRTSYFQLTLDNLSETRLYMKQGETDGFRAQFFAGMREEPYNVNGVSEKKVAFGIINLEPKINIDAEEIDGTLKIGDELIQVNLERNPHGTNFACDIEKMPPVEKDLILTIAFSQKVQNEATQSTQVFNLVNVMPADAINWERALEIATDKMLPQIKRAGKFECYVKIVECPVKNNCNHSFWYVRFIPEKGENFFVVIDSTGKIID